MNIALNLRSSVHRRDCARRRGVTMLEVIIAGSMLAMVMTSLSVVLRTSRVAWEANDDDYGAMHQAHAVTRHFVRQAREASRVNAINTSSITLEMQDGDTLTWRHLPGTINGLTDAVMVNSTSVATESALAYQVRKLTFTGFKADSVTATKTASEVRVIEIAAEVVLPRGKGVTQTVASKVWIRSW